MKRAQRASDPDTYRVVLYRTLDTSRALYYIRSSSTGQQECGAVDEAGVVRSEP